MSSFNSKAYSNLARCTFTIAKGISLSSLGEIFQKQGVFKLGERHIVAVCVHGETVVLASPNHGAFDESCDWHYNQVESDTSQHMSVEFMPRCRLQACDKDEDNELEQMVFCVGLLAHGRARASECRSPHGVVDSSIWKHRTPIVS